MLSQQCVAYSTPTTDVTAAYRRRFCLFGVRTLTRRRHAAILSILWREFLCSPISTILYTFNLSYIKIFPFSKGIYIYIIHAIKRREGNKKKGEVSVNESKNVFHTCSTCFLRVFHKHNTRPSMLLHSFLHSNVAAAVEISKVFHKQKRNLFRTTHKHSTITCSNMWFCSWAKAPAFSLRCYAL